MVNFVARSVSAAVTPSGRRGHAGAKHGASRNAPMSQAIQRFVDALTGGFLDGPLQLAAAGEAQHCLQIAEGSPDGGRQCDLEIGPAETEWKRATAFADFDDDAAPLHELHG